MPLWKMFKELIFYCLICILWYYLALILRIIIPFGLLDAIIAFILTMIIIGYTINMKNNIRI